MSQSTDELNALINGRAEAMAERILDLKMVSKQDIATIILANFKDAMLDMLRQRKSAEQEEYDELRYNLFKYKGREKIIKTKRFHELKTKRKEVNVLYVGLEKHIKYRELVNWMKEHHPESLRRFYEEYEKKYPEEI